MDRSWSTTKEDTNFASDRVTEIDKKDETIRKVVGKGTQQHQAITIHENRYVSLDESHCDEVTRDIGQFNQEHCEHPKRSELTTVLEADKLNIKCADLDYMDLSYTPRHKNGHLLLKNSIYSRLEGHSNKIQPPTNRPSPFNSDFSSLFNTSTSSSLISNNFLRDSGVSSEASSTLEHFFNTNEVKQGESNSSLCQKRSSVDDLQKLSTQPTDFEDFPSSNITNTITSDPEILSYIVEENFKFQNNQNSLDHISATTNKLLHRQNVQTEGSFLEFYGDVNEVRDIVQKQHLDNKNSDWTESNICKNVHIPDTRISSRKIIDSMGKDSKKSDMAIEESFYRKYTSCRWRLAYLCFLARFVQTALRQCMGVAVIGMTMKKALQIGALSSRNTTSNSSEMNITKTSLDQTPDFEWSSLFEGAILTSFNVGSIITPIIVGYLTTRHGGRKLMTLCLLVGGALTVCLPGAANISPVFIIIFRVLTGVALSGTDSLIQAMLAKWAPLSEKASLSACAYTGLSAAGVLTFLVCGYIVSIGGEGKGWPYIFYIFGGLCLLLAPLWYFTVYNSPDSNPRITKTELAIIAFNKIPENHETDKELNPPWKRMFLSPAVWVILMGHITHKWILSFMLSYLPRYFSDMFRFDMKTDGLLSSLPFAGRIVSGLAAGFLSDWMIRKGVSTARTRKFFQATGCWGCAAYSLLIAFVPSMSNVWSISLLVLALSSQDLTSVAFRINLLDIAPKYAGLLNGMVSTVATLTSLPAPVITSQLISGGSRHGWQVVFCLVAGLNILGGAIFLMFAKGEVQTWAQATYVEHTRKQTESEMNIFTLDIDSETKTIKYQVTNERVLREVKSLPANIQRQSSHQKEKVTRRATFDVASLIKRVQNDAFINLALADM